MIEQERLNKLIKSMELLTNGQVDLIEPVIFLLLKPYKCIERNPKSDFISDCILTNLGDAIRVHHCFSKGPFTKDKFEYAMEAVFNFCGNSAILAPNGNPGHDITINGEKISLKTEAESSIKVDKIHISKFMELGRGNWDNTESTYQNLRKQFLKHLEAYERIFTLRCLSHNDVNYKYELVEIPKALLQESTLGKLEICTKSRQNLFPAYYHIFATSGEEKFSLYFDGGGERKLQIKNLNKSYCITHATWSFSINSDLP